MLKFGGNNFVELDFNNGEGKLSTIPDEIGPWMETRLGLVTKSSSPRGSLSFRSNAEFAAIALTPSPNQEVAYASDRFQSFDAPVGQLVISPSNVDKRLRWSSPKEILAVGFNSEAHANLAATELDGADWEMQPPKFGHVDLRALRLARAMALEISEASTNELYLDSLLTVFGVHLIRNYSKAKLKQTTVQNRRRLSPQTSKKVLEYMHEHMADNLSIEIIARISRMSASHFIRAFSMTFGIPPHKYLVRIRLQAAERLLLETRLSISDIALQTGFSSQSHLTNAMMRYSQMTPGKIRMGGA
jgi:AraC family transcriptional regulator